MSSQRFPSTESEQSEPFNNEEQVPNYSGFPIDGLLQSVKDFFSVPQDMANSYSKIAISGTVLVIVVSVAYVYLKNSSRGGGGGDETANWKKTMEDVKRKHKKIREEHEKYLRDFEMETRRNEEELERLHRLRMEETRQRRMKNLKQMTETNRMDEMKRISAKQESDKQYEQMKGKLQIDNFMKDSMMKLHFDALQGKNQEELDNMEKERNRIRQQNQERIDAENEKYEEKRVDFEKEEALQMLEMEREKERFERRMEEIREKLAEHLEEMHRRDAQRKREMEDQLREIQRMLRNRIWNEIIENNWTRRLNTLRSANHDVDSVYRSMRSHSGNKQMLEAHSRSLLVAIENERRLMDNESREMVDMYATTGKSFLLEIKQSVEHVKKCCDNLKYSVQKLDTVHMDKCFNDLSSAVMSIPTLAELKHRYAESMRQGSSN